MKGISESVLISTLIMEPARIAEAASHLSPSDLADPRNRLLYEGMLELMARGEVVDDAAVIEWLEQTKKIDEVGESHVALLVGMYDANVELPWHLKELRRQARVRRFEATLRLGVEELDRGHDPEVVWSTVRENLDDLGETYSERKEDDLLQITAELMAEVERKGERGLRWPFPEMNKEVGLLVPGRLWLVSGFSGSGKSAHMRSLALGMLDMPETAAGVPKPAYFALEEKGADVLGLMACAAAGVSYTRFGRGEELSDLEQERIRQGVELIYNSGRLTLNRQKLWTPSQLLAKIRVYAAEGRANVVFVDHAHLIDYPGRTDNERDLHVAAFAERLHAYADIYGFTAIVAYQPRKPGEGGDIWRPVSPDEIRGTSRVWNIAENTLSPYRPWVQVDSRTLEDMQDEHGRPLVCQPYAKSKPDAERQWVGRPVQDFAFLQPGKARIGGYSADAIVLRFDQLSGRITSRVAA